MSAAEATFLRLAHLWLPIFVLFTVHNLEEIFLDLPAWGRAQGVVLPTTQLNQTGFALLIVGLSVILFVLAYFLRGNRRATRRFLMAFLAVMALNFVWHVAASLMTASVQPGVVTALLFLPVFAWLFLKTFAARPV